MLLQTRSLTLGAVIGAPTVREGLPSNSTTSHGRRPSTAAAHSLLAPVGACVIAAAILTLLCCQPITYTIAANSRELATALRGDAAAVAILFSCNTLSALLRTIFDPRMNPAVDAVMAGIGGVT